MTSWNKKIISWWGFFKSIKDSIWNVKLRFTSSIDDISKRVRHSNTKSFMRHIYDTCISNYIYIYIFNHDLITTSKKSPQVYVQMYIWKKKVLFLILIFQTIYASEPSLSGIQYTTCGYFSRLLIFFIYLGG